MTQKRYLIGVLSISSIIITLILSINQNTWFSWTQNSLSDLGSSQATNPWIFNYGIIITALLGISYFSKLRKTKLNFYSKTGLAALIIDFITLVLIGVYPLGSDLHYPLSITFFALLPIATTLYGVGKLKINKKKGSIIILVTLLGFLTATALLMTLNGVAAPEIIGVLVIASVVFVEK